VRILDGMAHERRWVTAVVNGRPLRVAGQQRFTRLVHSADWTAPVELAPVGEDERALLAEIWTDDARAEHASVAAFAKLTLELVALGAPPQLVARASYAAVQEVEHARLCFALASAYRGAPLGPAPLPEAVVGDVVELDRIARESLLDGCMCEGIAAEAAQLGAQSATDPAVARVLRIQAADEAQHAELAWAIVEWCISLGGEPLRTLLREALGEATLPRCHDLHLPAHGRIGKHVLEPRFEQLRARARERLARACHAAA
jgi:hypothetical protein